MSLAYEKAQEAMRVAGSAFRAAGEAYRARKIDNAEYLAARAAYEEAERLWEIAFEEEGELGS